MCCNFNTSRYHFGFAPVGVPEYDHGVNFDIGPSTDDIATCLIIESWMKDCLNHHALCQQAIRNTAFRPTRLLELSPEGTYRLINRSQCPPDLEYAALSYCWGTKPATALLRLLRTTFGYLSHGGPLESLPRTFSEAAKAAQRLGVIYLWIDRLCIFQDSTEDWQQEAASMKEVYQNCKFSIAALGAEDSDAGCFFERNPAKVAPTIVCLQLGENEEPTRFRYEYEDRWSWKHSFYKEPLLKRAWVVQERLLAPRTVYFGSRQVFWECYEAKCAETNPQGVGVFDSTPPASGKNPLPRAVCGGKELLDFPRRFLASDDYEQLFEDWHCLVTFYSARSLTMPADKLVAISGMAQDMMGMLNKLKPGLPHRYLAGLWEEKLVQTLSWEVDWAAARAPHYRAPSWSWACLDAQVNGDRTYSGAEDICLTSCEAVDMVYRTEDETGQVLCGAITLSGPCALIDIANDLPRRGQGRRQTTVRWKGVQGRDGYVAFDGVDYWDKFAEVIFDTRDDFTTEALFIWLTFHGGDSLARGEGLLLAPLSDGTYRRIGIAQRFFEGAQRASPLIDCMEKQRVVVA
ncbi:heterokaryon incompatibility protein-domain-containing protein [Microdochium trichocladiopsis]|uniref:Heterokaryon incompatibility protein-domain-containing protein n=1 Tax=Microdochium trichocladiopsis TaxID=1682393 RepID=A0A9P8XY32_9PEZI|nr:heterokaryon incompatibility protein-domain-containing protein [Microdochium trichocladiopsis]KAH7018568.1 heterokaryon incompatibility protein-domain-containing protein [Microdochium trichocladiopsis]